MRVVFFIVLTLSFVLTGPIRGGVGREMDEPFNAERIEAYYIAETLNDFRALEKLGWFYYDLRCFAQAGETFERLSAKTVPLQDFLLQGRAELALALVHLRLDNPKISRGHLEKGAKVLPWPRGPGEMALLKFIEAETAFYEERQVAALSLATAALSIVEHSGDTRLLKMILFLIGEKGPTGNRAAFLMRCLNVENYRCVFVDVAARIVLASLEMNLGKPEEGLAYIVPVTEQLRPGLSDRLIFSSRREEGRIRMSLGRLAGSIRSYVLARNSAKRLNLAYDFGDITVPLAQCCIKKNMKSKAIEYIDQALETVHSELHSLSTVEATFECETKRFNRLKERLMKERAKASAPDQ